MSETNYQPRIDAYERFKNETPPVAPASELQDELNKIKELLDTFVPEEVGIGTDSTFDRIEWLKRRLNLFESTLVLRNDRIAELEAGNTNLKEALGTTERFFSTNPADDMRPTGLIQFTRQVLIKAGHVFERNTPEEFALMQEVATNDDRN